jgi:hypothetical protein
MLTRIHIAQEEETPEKDSGFSKEYVSKSIQSSVHLSLADVVTRKLALIDDYIAQPLFVSLDYSQASSKDTMHLN